MSNRKEYMRNYQKANKEKLQEYYKQWKLKNPDKIKTYNETYYKKHKKQILYKKYCRKFIIEEN